MVARVEAHHGTLAEGGALHVARAPVRNVGVVEARLEELVLEHQTLVAGEPLVDRGQRLRQAFLAGPDVVLARVVGAVGQPDLQVARAGLAHDLDAPQMVVDGGLTDRSVGVGEAAELVDVVLEGVGVDRAEAQAEVGGVGAELGEVVDLVPRDVEGDARGEPGDGVDLGGVGQLLERVTGHAGLGEHLEPGARVAIGPRRHLDRLPLEHVERCLTERRGVEGHRISPVK